MNKKERNKVLKIKFDFNELKKEQNKPKGEGNIQKISRKKKNKRS